MVVTGILTCLAEAGRCARMQPMNAEIGTAGGPGGSGYVAPRNRSLVLIFGLLSLGIGLLVIGPGALLANAMASTFVPAWMATVATAAYAVAVVAISVAGIWLGWGARAPDQARRYRVGLILSIASVPCAIAINVVLIIIGQLIGPTVDASL